MLWHRKTNPFARYGLFSVIWQMHGGNVAHMQMSVTYTKFPTEWGNVFVLLGTISIFIITTTALILSYTYTFTDHKPLASIYLPIHVQQHRQRINNRCFNEFTMATVTLWKNTWITLFIEKIHPPYGINMDFYSNTKSTILLDKLNARLCNKEGKMIFPSGQRTKRLILYSWNHFIADITSLDSTLCFKSI